MLLYQFNLEKVEKSLPYEDLKELGNPVRKGLARDHTV